MQLELFAGTFCPLVEDVALYMATHLDCICILHTELELQQMFRLVKVSRTAADGTWSEENNNDPARHLK